MLYRLYLYKSTAATASAPAIGMVNVAISTNSEREWKRDCVADFMDEFDTAAVKAAIERELTDSATGQCKCRVSLRFPPKQYNQVGFLYIATSYQKAKEVLPRLHAIAAKNSLALYDAETGRTFFKDLIDDTFITIKNRQQALNNAIFQDMQPVWHIRRLAFSNEERDKSSDYVVTLRKAAGVSFLQRTEQFCACLKHNLIKGETLVCENKCYTIKGEWYSITYVLEGYKKHADRIGYTEDEVCHADLLYRMGCEEAFKWMSACCEKEIDDIYKRMFFLEMVDTHPNPADRFVLSVRITKWQRKQKFDLRYSGLGNYDDEILFHIVPHSYYQDVDRISVLKIEESSASFILPFINDVYPHFYKRYYLAENYLPTEMWKDILTRLEAAKKMILNDPFNPKLTPYIKRFNLFVFSENESDVEQITKNPALFLFDHRYEVAHLYDIFTDWSVTQLYYYDISGDERMFNIQGP